MHSRHLQHPKAVSQSRAAELVSPEQGDLVRLFEILSEREHIPLLNLSKMSAHEGRSPSHASHFFMVTVVPLPTSEVISNSSMIRLAPGNPIPNPFADE